MKLFDKVHFLFLFLPFLTLSQPYCAPEPITKRASRCDPTEGASVSERDVPDGGCGAVRQMEGGGLQAKSPVTLRGTSGCRADKMRSDMPSPFLSVTPPHQRQRKEEREHSEEDGRRGIPAAVFMLARNQFLVELQSWEGSTAVKVPSSKIAKLAYRVFGTLAQQ